MTTMDDGLAVDEDDVRTELVSQLRDSLARARKMMVNEKMDPRTRERWMQLHTKTAQVLNQILRDKQLSEWEKRLKDLEALGHVPERIGR